MKIVTPLFGALLAMPSAMAAVPVQTGRTAMWYVGHPQEMKLVLEACRNDPGHAKSNPDCDNVSQAEVIIAQAETLQHADLTPPSDPRYWRIHPKELGPQLFICSKLPQNMRTVNFCDSADAAIR